MTSTSSANISESFEESLSSLLSNAPATAFSENDKRDGIIKRTFHLGGSKYAIFHGTQGIIKNIYLKEWDDGEVINKGIKLSVPKLAVILHYVEFIMNSTEKK